MYDFHFIRPFWLLALIPLVLLGVFNFKRHLQQGAWQTVCDLELLPFILNDHNRTANRRPLILISLASLLAIIALAGPTWQRIPTPVFRNSAALVIALDLSRSMDASDIKPSRLIRARYKIADLLKKRKDGQTALLVYSQDAFTVTPLTDDIETINSQLNALKTGIMPAQGSRTHVAINKAVQLMQNAGLQTGHILLVTDENQAINTTLASAYQLSVLAVGSSEGAPIKLADGGFLKDSQGNIVLPKLNLPQLQTLVTEHNGMLQLITDSDHDINQLSEYFAHLSTRRDTEAQEQLFDYWQEEGIWLLLPIILFGVLQFRKGLLSVAFILLPYSADSHAIEWQDLWQTPDQQAQAAYQQGNFKAAAEKFTDSAWQAAAQYKAKLKPENLPPAKTATGFYNQGNVLAQSGQLEAAIKAYDKALALEPKHQDAQYNKELVEKALEKQKQEQEQQEKEQQQEQQEQQEQNPENDSKNQNSKNSDQAAQQDQKSNDSPSQDKDSEQAQQSNTEPSKPSKESQSENKQADAKQSEPEEGQAESKEAQASSEQESLDKSEQQANEQWLKRIADDPAGLLKRKFLYQYSRQPQQQNSEQKW